MSFICSIEIFSDRETLELLTVSISFADLVPRLTFTLFCFVCGTVRLVFICDYRKCRRLSGPHFLSFGWMSLFFRVWTNAHILQFSSGTIPLDFVWLSHNALFTFSETTDLLVSFYFIHYPYVVWTATPFNLFFRVELSHFSLCECHTNILSVFIISVWISHICISIFFVWVSHKCPCVAITFKWALHFAFFWVITDPFSFLSSVGCHTSFLKWKVHLSYLFSHFW